MITQKQYELFLNNLTENIENDWVIIGGSLLSIIQASRRSTTDIDICSLSEMTNENRLLLMDLALKSGLPVEAINPAADFFLRQIPNWKNSLVLLKSGKKGNVFRPSLELYLKLKLIRASDTDIEDCINFFLWHKNNNLEINREKLKEIINTFLANNLDKLKKLIDSL